MGDDERSLISFAITVNDSPFVAMDASLMNVGGACGRDAARGDNNGSRLISVERTAGMASGGSSTVINWVCTGAELMIVTTARGGGGAGGATLTTKPDGNVDVVVVAGAINMDGRLT